METVFTFASTNYSIYAENCLLAAGYSVRILPLPASIKAGCGLCVRIAEKQTLSARQALLSANIPVEGIYTRTLVENESQYIPWEGANEQ